jgi:hypothetical protein
VSGSLGGRRGVLGGGGDEMCKVAACHLKLQRSLPASLSHAHFSCAACPPGVIPVTLFAHPMLLHLNGTPTARPQAMRTQ